MHDSVATWVIGSLSIASLIASTVLNALIAFNTSTNDRLIFGLRILLFVTFGLAVGGVLSLVYFTAFYVRKVTRGTLGSNSSIWTVLGTGVITFSATSAASCAALVWLTTEHDHLSKRILQQSSTVWLSAWFGTWGVSTLIQVVLFVFLGFWTKRILKRQSAGRLDLDFGIRIPPTSQVENNDSRRSLTSRDTTLASPPRTPTSTRAGSSMRHSMSNRTAVGAATSKTKLIGRNSARSSIDVPPFPTNEIPSSETAFDRWDTSSVHSEMRAAVGSSPPVTRSGLETIPGSRPDTPADILEARLNSSSPHARTVDHAEVVKVLDEPFLPSSPMVTSSETTTTTQAWSSPPRPQQFTSSPPSSPTTSPPNFSRPTSKRENKLPSQSYEMSMQELIHPLFRTNSPHPPPVATAGTIIHVSPISNDPITPRTLARIRSRSNSFGTKQIQQSPKTGHWRAMPSIDYSSSRPGTAPSRPGSSGGLTTIGSPGPSVVDEDELPPILPGFVLSAGSRSSFVGYNARKSVKRERERRTSELSIGAR